MPSHEDYLDSLLKNLEQGTEQTDDTEESMIDEAEEPIDEDALLADVVSDLEEVLGPELTADPKMDPDDEPSESILDDMATKLEALSNMSEDDIEKLLSSGTDEDTDVPEKKADALEDIDILSMLDRIDDEDLQDIHEMLDRADNNEAVDASVLQKSPPDEPPDLDADGADDQKPLSAKERRAQEKMRKKQEKAAAREAKAAAKAAAKEAKAAAKAAKSGEAVSAAPTAVQGAKEEKPASAGEPFDTSLLDSIVSEADMAEQAKGTDSEMENMGEDDLPDISELFSGMEDSLNVGNDSNVSSSASVEDTKAASKGDEGDSGGLGFDMNSLFGDVDDGDISGDSGESDIPDFVALDAEEAENLIPEHSEPDQEQEPKPAKKGLFSKFVEFLTEEDEEEEESESLQLSDENRDILNDLDKEKGKKKKKKKKGKKADASAGDGEEEGGKGKGKGGKAKKPKKPKKEKPVKEVVPEPEPLIPERKLTLKRVMPVILVCVSFAVLIIVFTSASVSYTDRQTAHEAYYAGDYQTCFQNLYGKDLNETEQVMFGKSESILYIRLWLREYEMLAEDGAEVEALDSLIQTVNDYPKLYDYAVKWNADSEVAAGYQNILNILFEKYGLTEEQAREIAAVRSDKEYTRMVVEIVQGEPFGAWNEPDPTPEPEPAPLQDVLPEEEDLDEGAFVDNQEGSVQ